MQDNDFTSEEDSFRILHTEWSSGWGGQEKRIVLECRRMLDKGHRASIACQPDSQILVQAGRAGIPVHPVSIRGSFDFAAIKSLVRIIRQDGIDVVNTHSGKDSWVGGFAAKISGARILVRTRHLSIPISKNPLNFVHRMPDGFVTTGEVIRKDMIRNNGVHPDKIISIATGVDLSRFHPDADGRAIRKELGIAHEATVITMVAVLRGMKRHDLLIQAAKSLLDRHPGAVFLAVGEGPMREQIEGWVREAGIGSSFILTGHREDIPQVMAASDIVVLTSSKFEGVPQTLSQAMVMGKPVVASDVGSICELVLDGETGLMAEVGDAHSFSAAIGKLISDIPLRKKLGVAARRHILESYTDEVMIRKTLEFYRYLIENKCVKAA